MKVRVYIAGPYSGGNVAKNVHIAMEMWHTLKDLGYSPYCPHLTHFLDMHRERPNKEWLEYDIDWLETCHVLLRMPGKSSGSDGEVSEADGMEIPVVYTVSELLDLFPPDHLSDDDDDDEEDDCLEDGVFEDLLEADESSDLYLTEEVEWFDRD